MVNNWKRKVLILCRMKTIFWFNVNDINHTYIKYADCGENLTKNSNGYELSKSLRTIQHYP